MKIKKESLLWTSTLVLLVLNLVLLFILVFRPLGRINHHHDFQQRLIEKVGFDDNQQEKFFELVEQHQGGVEKLQQEIRKTRSGIFDFPKKNSKAYTDSLCSRVADLSFALEQLHIEHMVAVRAICVGGQIAQFDKLIREMPFMRSAHGHRHREH